MSVNPCCKSSVLKGLPEYKVFLFIYFTMNRLTKSLFHLSNKRFFCLILSGGIGHYGN
jgi:hypothetical protein